MNLFLVLFVLAQTILSQVNQFRFKKGTGVIFNSGNIADAVNFHADNLPRGRGGHSSWIKSNGDVFLFGGITNLETDRTSFWMLNDFWNYDKNVNNWKKLGGCNMQQGESNLPGSYSTNFFPGSRFGGMSWKINDDLFLYGGKGYCEEKSGEVVLGDIWKYVTSWSCEICASGQVADYVGDANKPGSRYLMTVFQKSETEVYLFGGSGFGYPSTNRGFMNDMFKFTGGVFSHVHGPREPFSRGTYGSVIQPDAMFGSTGWTVGNKLFLFGGRGMKVGSATPPSNDDLQHFNNLFYFDTLTTEWTFLGGGEDAINHLGSGENPTQEECGEKPINNVAESFSSSNWPGSRFLASGFSQSNELLLFGGLGVEDYTDGSSNGKPYSSVWVYNLVNSQWKVLRARRDAEGGEYSTMNSWGSNNHPGARYYSSVVETNDRVYLLFGMGADSSNTKYGAYRDTLVAATDELWEFYKTPSISCVPSCDHGTCIDNAGTPECNCDSGWKGTSCSETDCTTPCTTNQVCVGSNLCECIAGWENFPSCNVAQCYPICDHGSCTEPNVCTCTSGWTGGSCSDAICASCVNGNCISPNNCECITGYIGSACDVMACDGVDATANGVCNGHGACTYPDTCECESGYNGIYCNWKIVEGKVCFGKASDNPLVCSSRGGCVDDDLCRCDPGYLGLECDLIVECFGIGFTNKSVCNGHGTCYAADKCKCEFKYKGKECENFAAVDLITIISIAGGSLAFLVGICVILGIIAVIVFIVIKKKRSEYKGYELKEFSESSDSEVEEEEYKPKVKRKQNHVRQPLNKRSNQPSPPRNRNPPPPRRNQNQNNRFNRPIRGGRRQGGRNPPPQYNQY